MLTKLVYYTFGDVGHETDVRVIPIAATFLHYGRLGSPTSRVMVFPVRVLTKICILAFVPPLHKTTALEVTPQRKTLGFKIVYFVNKLLKTQSTILPQAHS